MSVIARGEPKDNIFLAPEDKCLSRERGYVGEARV